MKTFEDVFGPKPDCDGGVLAINAGVHWENKRAGWQACAAEFTQLLQQSNVIADRDGKAYGDLHQAHEQLKVDHKQAMLNFQEIKRQLDLAVEAGEVQMNSIRELKDELAAEREVVDACADSSVRAWSARERRKARTQLVQISNPGEPSWASKFFPAAEGDGGERLDSRGMPYLEPGADVVIPEPSSDMKADLDYLTDAMMDCELALRRAKEMRDKYKLDDREALSTSYLPSRDFEEPTESPRLNDQDFG